MSLKEDLERVKELMAIGQMKEARDEFDKLALLYPIPPMPKDKLDDFASVAFDLHFERLCTLAQSYLHTPTRDHPRNLDVASIALASMFGLPKTQDTYSAFYQCPFGAVASQRTRYLALNEIRTIKNGDRALDQYISETSDSYKRNNDIVSARAQVESFSEFANKKTQRAWVEKCVVKTVAQFPKIGSKGMLYLYVYGLACFRGDGASYQKTAEHHNWDDTMLNSYKQWLNRNKDVKAYFGECLAEGM